MLKKGKGKRESHLVEQGGEQSDREEEDKKSTTERK